MSYKKFELTLTIIGLLIASVTAIPTVYNFEKQTFFWEVKSEQKEATKTTDYKW